MLSFNFFVGVIVLGFGFNGNDVDSDKLKGFIEFNPNKILGNIVIQDGFVLDGFARCSDSPFLEPDKYDMYVQAKACFDELFSLLCTSCDYIELGRFDIACDIPVSRNKVQLFKDKRKYSQYCNSELDFTEYLGSSVSNGRVKVYNKTIEADLDFDVTRVEITGNAMVYEEFVKSVPRICIQGRLGDKKNIIHSLLLVIPSNERVKYLNMMDSRARKTYRELLDDSEYFDISESVFDNCMNMIRSDFLMESKI